MLMAFHYRLEPKHLLPPLLFCFGMLAGILPFYFNRTSFGRDTFIITDHFDLSLILSLTTHWALFFLGTDTTTLLHSAHYF